MSIYVCDNCLKECYPKLEHTDNGRPTHLGYADWYEVVSDCCSVPVLKVPDDVDITDPELDWELAGFPFVEHQPGDDLD